MGAWQKTMQLAIRGAVIAARPPRVALFSRVLVALVALALSFLIFPFLIAVFIGGRALERAAGAPDRAEGGGTMMAGFTLGAVMAVPAVALVLGAVVIAPALQDQALSYLVLAALVPVLGVASGPFLSVAPHALRRGQGVEAAIGRSLAASAVHGMAAAMLRGALVTAAVVVPVLLAVLEASLDHGGVALIVFLVLAPLSTTWLVGVSVAAADQDDAALADIAAMQVPRRAHLWIGPSIALSLLSLATALALFTPARAWMRVSPSISDCPSDVAERGPHGVTVARASDLDGERAPLGRSTDRSWTAYEVTTADGGGAGRILGPPRSFTDGVCANGRRGGLMLRFIQPMGHAVVGAPIDEHGVRLDDGLVDRLASRIGAGIGTLLLLGAVFLAQLARLVGRRLLLADRLTGAGDPLRSVRGAIVDDGAGPMFVAKDGTHRFPVPAAVTVVGATASGPPQVGTEATLVASEVLGSNALRSASAPWPSTAVLVLGEVDDARMTLLAALGREAGPWSAAATAAVAVAALMLFGQL